MVVAFTPGVIGGGGQNYIGGQDQAVLKLSNGMEISQVDASRARQNPPYNLIGTGEVGEDLQTLMLDDLVNENLLRKEASSVRVSNGEVRAAVNEFREDNGFAGSRNDQAYLNALSRQGYTDETFRAFVRDNERLEKYRDGLTEGIEVSDAEVQSYFEANRDRYRGDEKIIARQIIVSEENVAQELRARALNGEDFAALATEFSIEGAETGGAIGAADDSTDPGPVARLALPTQVANAAFSLGSGAVSDVVNQGGRFYVVKVEEFLPAEQQSFDEVSEQVKEDALTIKETGIIEAKLLELRQGLDIEVPEVDELTGISYNYDDSVVAKVGDKEITKTELSRNLYNNPQVQNFLSPQNAGFISSFFKPNTLNNLIDQELALQGADELGIDLIGSRAAKAQSAISYVTKDAEATEEEIQEYYDTNQSNYIIPASALVNRMNFETQEAALAFQNGVASGEISTDDLATIAEEQGFELQALGDVSPGILETELDTLLFGTEGFTAVPESFGREVSDVVVIQTETIPEPEVTEEATDETVEATTEDGSAEATATTDTTEGETETTEEVTAPEPIITESFVVLVANRTAERLQGLTEVRPQVEQAVLQEERNELRTTWLDGLREKIEVENVLFPPEPEVELTPEESFTTAPDPNAPVEVTTEDITPAEGSVDFENAEPTETSEAETTEAVETTETPAETVVETTTETVTEAVTEVEEAVTETTETVETVVETTTETITETAEAVEATSDNIVESTTNAVTETVATTTQTIAAGAAGTSSATQGLIEQLRTFRAAGDTDGIARIQEQLRTELRAVSGEGKIYTVQEGDTLSSISEAAYGSSIYFPDIGYANEFMIEDANTIFPGLDIILPTIIGTEGPNIGE